MIEFPVGPEAFLSVLGVAIFGSLVTQWLKRYVALDLVVNLVTLALCEAAAIMGALILAQWRPAAYDVFSAVTLAFIGATLAVFGYEVVKNAVDLIKPPTV